MKLSVFGLTKNKQANKSTAEVFQVVIFPGTSNTFRFGEDCFLNHLFQAGEGKPLHRGGSQGGRN